jgi:hypothetical protein
VLLFRAVQLLTSVGGLTVALATFGYVHWPSEEQCHERVEADPEVPVHIKGSNSRYEHNALDHRMKGRCKLVNKISHLLQLVFA